MTADEIGTTLAQLRKEQGMSLEALGRESNVTPKSIGRYEAGYAIPREYILEKLATALPLPLAEMIEASRIYHENQRIIRRGKRPKPEHTKRGPRRKSLPSEQRVSAVAWAADQAGMSYGHFVARTPQDAYQEIYRAYQTYLKEGCLCR